MLIGLLDELKNLNKPVKFLRLDDAGENFALGKACKQHHLGLQFEFSRPRTPQRNGKGEEVSNLPWMNQGYV
jgi:hypothetical protein